MRLLRVSTTVIVFSVSRMMFCWSPIKHLFICSPSTAQPASLFTNFSLARYNCWENGMANCPLEAQEDESLWRKGKLNVKVSSPVPSSENKKVSEWSPLLVHQKQIFRWTVRGRTWRSPPSSTRTSSIYLMHHFQNAREWHRNIGGQHTNPPHPTTHQNPTNIWSIN